jgi:hypothetical protein
VVAQDSRRVSLPTVGAGYSLLPADVNSRPPREPAKGRPGPHAWESDLADLSWAHTQGRNRKKREFFPTIT